ncbi:D-alanyl-D-alanine carboxypeptidase/D-alanyl-D-alanine endopeptidase [Sphingomonas sp. Leaf4]|uniref:D-alanyl-D-alanine carboxypeptidase/D-alanyl-D-alanine endopeptidase n=1 Tax=Sphingomonas sp. Leaf4 TaxID=2876553 RepID=UPI001E36DB66|nr:D-alanyl-D-alanine carboxypeptidase/D-alanyl-D-alanine-endopeptidase [Sphingomonas sp. Leaf4]
MSVVLALLLGAAPVEAQVREVLAEAPAGTRFGLVVVDDQGTEQIAIAPDDRFVPASNTKIFTTAAAFATLPVDGPDTAATGVRLEGDDVVLVGAGDARLSAAADCAVDCLATLADAVAARTRRVGDVIGDDSAFPDQRWSPGMAWNNIPTRSGTGISALSLDDNELTLTVRADGGGVTVAGPRYYRIESRIMPGPRSAIGVDRMPGSDLLRIHGTIAPGTVETIRVGIDDPAHYAAWTFAAMLRARGVAVRGHIGVRHRPWQPGNERAVVQRTAPPAMLATATPAPLLSDLRITNKASQNLHAELLLRRIGAVHGGGSIGDGIARVAALIEAAGVPRTAWDLSDGSGMSTYNRVSPRAMVRFLRWIDGQPWGAAWGSTLPVAGVDGTLARRFQGTALAGRLSAKTGSLSGTSALAGVMTATSGRRLTFAFYANDVPEGGSATAIMDRALLTAAAAL